MHKPAMNHKTMRFRDYKEFNEALFINDLESNTILKNVYMIDDVNEAWQTWFSEFNNISNKHAPFKVMRVRNKPNPWITPEIVKLMNKIDHIHKKACKDKNSVLWQEYKQLRNDINNRVRHAKKCHCYNLINLKKDKPQTCIQSAGNKSWPICCVRPLVWNEFSLLIPVGLPNHHHRFFEV